MGESHQADQHETGLAEHHRHLLLQRQGNRSQCSTVAMRGEITRLGHRKPGDHADQRRRDGIGQKGHRQTIVFGKQATRIRAHANRKQKAALIDRHHAAAPLGRADISQHDHPDGQHDAAAQAGDEASQQELDEGAAVARPEIAEHTHHTAQGQRRTPPDPIGHLPGRHRRQKASTPEHRDGGADRRNRDIKGLGIKRQYRHDRTKPELIEEDDRAHPEEHATFFRTLHAQNAASSRPITSCGEVIGRGLLRTHMFSIAPRAIAST